VIKRRNLLNGKEELVLDIMQYYSLKKFYKTIELVKTSFSQSHRYIAFGYDLNNNEHVRWMVKDIKENKILGIKGWEQNVLE
jgi:protease II